MTSVHAKLNLRYRPAWHAWRRTCLLVAATGALSLILSSAMYAAEQPAPRTIADITALLDQYKPDEIAIASLRAQAMQEPQGGTKAEALAAFYWERAQAWYELGDGERSLADLRSAHAIVKGSRSDAEWRIEYDLSVAENQYGDPKAAATLLASLLARAGEYTGRRLDMETDRMHYALRNGNLAEARAAFGVLERVLKYLQSQPGPGWAQWGGTQTSAYQRARAALLEQEGRLAAAESAHRSAIAAWETFLKVNPRTAEGFSPVRRRQIGARNTRELALARNLSLQGRYSESELVIRGSLTRTLAQTGRYSVETAGVVNALAQNFIEHGRYADTESMARAAIEILSRLGVSGRSQRVTAAYRRLGSALVYQSRWSEAAGIYERITGGDPELLKVLGGRDRDWLIALIKSGRAAEAAADLEGKTRDVLGRLGKDHYQTAEWRGLHALSLAGSGQVQRAAAEFREAVRILLTPGKVSGDEREASPARSRRLIWILEGYVRLLYDTRADAGAGIDPVAEAFRVADAMRGQAVQGALAASAARAAAGTPALAELVRKEQDAKQVLSIQYATLLRMLNAPTDQQLPQVVVQMRARIAELEKEQRGMAAEVQKRFPAYAELVNPRPATLDQARAALREGEVLLSVLTTAERTYVWAVPKQGTVSFHAATMGEAEIGALVSGLRRALDVGAVAITRVPEFDVGQAAKLYDALLKPVEGAWKGAQTLLVVANGALAQLPFGVLPTGSVTGAPQALRFEQYKSVPWLIKQIAVTQLPAVNTLVTLRALAQGNAQRTAFAGFGDPQFGGKQAAAPASAQVALRNMDIRRVTEAALRDGNAPVNYIPYSALPPLPDTREEILAIATALKADLNRDVFLGLAASKQSLKSANLANRRIVAFATHGLVPGDFPNLDQPALALSSPDGKAESGLLTLEDILQLKLDADWVVLSACNTAAGDGAGAEAISGLGRGFFYAGSRALLVTHWPVETVSAKHLVTKIFERYAADSKLTRAEALRQAHLAMMDENAIEGGKAAYSYAHPLFWAPYALVGDGGR